MSEATLRDTRGTFDDGIQATGDQVQASQLSEEALEAQIAEPRLVGFFLVCWWCHVRRKWQVFNGFRCSLALLVEVRPLLVPVPCLICA